MTNFSTPRRTFVRGDWMPDDAAPYPALVTGTWNGWACPSFDAETARRLVADQAANPDLDPEVDASLAFDGDTLVVTYPDADGYDPDRVEPRDGLYDVSLGWTWFEVDEHNEATASADAPTEAQKEAHTRVRESLGMALHSGMRTVEDDGTHVFPLSLNLGRTTEDGIAVHETVALIAIAPDGSCSARPVEEA